MSYVYMFLLMMFLHITNDFCLQGDLKKMKQKRWWQENHPQKLYKYDYVFALILHSLSWSFMVLTPVLFFGIGATQFVIAVISNTIVHAIVDNAKANSLTISLAQDEIFHMIQIAMTILVLFAL